MQLDFRATDDLPRAIALARRYEMQQFRRARFAHVTIAYDGTRALVPARPFSVRVKR